MTEAELAEIIRHAIDKSCVYVGGADPLNAVTVDGTVDLLQVARDVLDALKPGDNEAHAAHQSALDAAERHQRARGAADTNVGPGIALGAWPPKP